MKGASEIFRNNNGHCNSASIAFNRIASARVFPILVWVGILFHSSFGQVPQDQSNNRFVFGDVNDSGNLTFDVPLGNFKGRGLDLPVSLSYSSDVWRIEHLGTVHRTIPGYSGWIRQSVTEAIYAKDSRAGWRSGLDLPVIEWPKGDALYDHQGKQGQGAGTCTFWVREVYIHMPDGSTHTLRKYDQPSNSSPNGIDRYGTFYAVDGSRIRFDANGTTDTGTIVMPDGTTYVLSHPTSSITDRNGNALYYNESSMQWTDTLGRVITNPIPAVPSTGDFSYSLPGLAGVNGGLQTYTFKWRNLADALTPDGSGNPPALKVVASEFLPYPGSAPGDGNFPESQGSQYQPLFKSSFIYAYGENGPLVGTLIVGRGQTGNVPFNPVVLSEIVMPDGTSYKFSYNVYGEVDKVIYPTNAYDRYEYYGPPPGNGPPEDYQEQDPQPYIQALRSLSSKKISVDGSGTDIREWKYSFYKDLDGGSGSSVIAPDKTRTVTYNYGPGPKSAAYTGPPSNPSVVMIYPFGYRDARLGMPSVKKFYSSSVDGLGGELLRQEVFQYEQTTVNYPIVCDQSPDQPSGNINRNQPLSRTPRLTRKTDFIFEGSGPALAQSSTFQYDLTNEFSTGIDQTLAATYHYVVVANQTAQDTDTPDELVNISLGTLAKYSETTYLNDSVYRNANILGQPRVAQIKDAAGTVVSQSEIVYDESGYVPSGTTRGLPTSMKTWDSTKGVVTNSSAYLVTHTTFDTFGNRTIATDAMGYSTTSGALRTLLSVIGSDTRTGSSFGPKALGPARFDVLANGCRCSQRRARARTG